LAITGYSFPLRGFGKTNLYGSDIILKDNVSSEEALYQFRLDGSFNVENHPLSGSYIESSDFAPSTLTDKTYKMAIFSIGASPETTEIATIVFGSETTYNLFGDGTNISSDEGTYTYSLLDANNTASLTLVLNALNSTVSYRFIYSSATQGRFGAVLRQVTRWVLSLNNHESVCLKCECIVLFMIQ
jgi:hypothetical protein